MWTVPLSLTKPTSDSEGGLNRAPTNTSTDFLRVSQPLPPGSGLESEAANPNATTTVVPTTTNRRHKVVNDFLINEDGLSMAARQNTILSAQVFLKNLVIDDFERLQQHWKGKNGSRVVVVEEFLAIVRPLLMRGGMFDSQGNRLFQDDDGDVGLQSASRLNCRKKRSDVDNYVHDLFTTIDAPRHGYVSWDDFISFMIDDVMKSQGTKFLGKNVDDPQYVYRGDCSVRDPTKRVSLSDVREWYSKLYYYESMDRIVSIWRNNVYLIPPAHLTPTMHLHTLVAEHKNDVFCCEYVSESNALMTASRSNTPISVWTAGTNLMVLKKQLGFPSHVTEDDTWIHVMKHTSRITNDHSGVMLLGTRSGTMHEVSLQSKANKEWRLKIRHSVPIHKGSITDLLVLPSNGSVVTCGVDSKVCIVNTYHDPKSSIVELFGHKRGVYSLSYSNEYNYIVSGGYEGFAYCWVANMGNEPAFKLEDPSDPGVFPLVAVKCLPSSPHIVTLDNRGTYKLFDVRMVKLVESWKLRDCVDPGHYGSNPVQGNECISSFAYTGTSHRQLVCSGRKLYVFDHHAKATESPRLAHSTKETIVAASYSAATDDFVTATSKTITLWSGATGCPKCSHQNLTPHTITQVAVDGAAGKFLLGLSNGDVTCHVLETGVQIRTYTKHERSVTSLVVDSHNSFIYSTSLDGLFCVWQDSDSATELKLMELMKATTTGAFGTTTKKRGSLDVKQLFTASHQTSDNVEKAAKKFMTSLSSNSSQNNNNNKTTVPIDLEAAIINTPLARVQLESSVRQVIAQPSLRTVAVVMVRDYFSVYTLHNVPKLIRTHRVNVDADEIVMSCWIGQRPLIVFVDTTALFQLWEVSGKTGEEGQLLRKWFNYSPFWKPHVLDRNSLQHLLEKDQELPSRIVPAVNCMTFDPVKQLLITGDEKGYIVEWDVTTSWMQYTNHAEPARIHAFEAHNYPILFLEVITSPTHSILSAAGNNSVFISLHGGNTICALRQGPLVERYWNFTDHEEALRRSNARLRWLAFRNLGIRMILEKRNPERTKITAMDVIKKLVATVSIPFQEELSPIAKSMVSEFESPQLSARRKSKTSLLRRKSSSAMLDETTMDQTFAAMRRMIDRKMMPRVMIQESGRNGTPPKPRTHDSYKKALNETANESLVELETANVEYKRLRGYQETMKYEIQLQQLSEDEEGEQGGGDGLHTPRRTLLHKPESLSPTCNAVPLTFAQHGEDKKTTSGGGESADPKAKIGLPRPKVPMTGHRAVALGGEFVFAKDVAAHPLSIPKPSATMSSKTTHNDGSTSPTSMQQRRSKSEMKIRNNNNIPKQSEMRSSTPQAQALIVGTAKLVPSTSIHNLSTIKSIPALQQHLPTSNQPNANTAAVDQLMKILKLCGEADGDGAPSPRGKGKKLQQHQQQQPPPPPPPPLVVDMKPLTSLSIGTRITGGASSSFSGTLRQHSIAEKPPPPPTRELSRSAFLFDNSGNQFAEDGGEDEYDATQGLTTPKRKGGGGGNSLVLPHLKLHGHNAPSSFLSGYKKIM
eukprot:PhF_6_TR29426/c1_g1_i1/m.43556